MSNPVAPPPADDGYPPPNDGYAGAPAPGQPYGAPPAPGQPYYGALPPAGQSYGAPSGGQSYGAPPGGQSYGAPPGGQSYGAPPAAGQPYGGPPEAGQPYGGQVPQGFGGPAALPVEPRKKSFAGKLLLRILASLVVIVIIMVARTFLFGDKATDAAVGDCIASSADVRIDEETEADAKVVDCSSGEAAFTVVGRVEGESDIKSKSCEKFFKENEEYYVYGSVANGGYLLCLAPRS